MKIFKIAFKFFMVTLCFMLAGYIGSYAFYDLNSTAADIHIALACMLIMFGFFIIGFD